MSASSSAARPEYQHFVPQFLLRNFAHPYSPPKNGTQRQKRSKKKGARIYSGDPVVNNVNLTVDPLSLEETPVKRVLGIDDMYQDTNQPTPQQQRYIESLFGRLESEASPIFRRIVKASEGGDQGLWLTRQERDRIRKFLFLLKYRGSTFHQRYYRMQPSDYDYNDQEQLRDYMREKGFERPVDVWFHNIKAFAELEMDVGNKWITELLLKVYPADAMWFISHVQQMYMAICTPEDDSDQFVLTDNSYNVFEGVDTYVRDPETGKPRGSSWVNFHEFAPVSPKLMIVLRSFLIPVPEEDANAATKAERDLWRKMAVDDVFAPGTKSSLADLPITKARNNYSEVINGQVRSTRSDTTKRKDDRFCFSFFRLGTDHVNRINGFLLDNARNCTRILFQSRDSFKKTLEWYMTEPCEYGKQVLGADMEARLKLLKGLAALMRSMGSSAKPVWDESRVYNYPLSDTEKMRLMSEAFKRICKKYFESPSRNTSPVDKQKSGDMPIYTLLGGSMDTFVYDVEQSQKMMQLRIKIDSWSQGVPEYIRKRNRGLLEDAYMQLPPCRVWQYCQRVDQMHIFHGDIEISGPNKISRDSPENVVAEAASRLTKGEKLNRLIFHTTMNKIEKMKKPLFDPWVNVNVGEWGASSYMSQILRTQKFLFASGKLKECGIPEIEWLATEQEKLIIERGLHLETGFDNPFYDEEDTIEVLTRVRARPKFREAIGAGKVDGPLLKKMATAFFDFTYPTPPVK